MARIKICGLRRGEDIAYVNECKPDFAGFVFAESRRKVAKEQAKELRRLLSPEIIPVGVFVNEEIETIAELVQEGIIDVVQLHGDETEEYIQQLRWRVGDAAIIKAVRVAAKEDVVECDKTSADYLLFDSRSLETYGGTGTTFDWKLIKDISKPFFLAGGINVENVEEAIKMLHPFAVDVSSAVETDGFKDREKISRIVKLVKEEESKEE